MKKKQVKLIRIIGLLVALLVSGCAAATSKDDPNDDGLRSVRASGDITISTVHRNGF